MLKHIYDQFPVNPTDEMKYLWLYTGQLVTNVYKIDKRMLFEVNPDSFTEKVAQARGLSTRSTRTYNGRRKRIIYIPAGSMVHYLDYSGPGDSPITRIRIVDCPIPMLVGHVFEGELLNWYELNISQPTPRIRRGDLAREKRKMREAKKTLEAIEPTELSCYKCKHIRLIEFFYPNGSKSKRRRNRDTLCMTCRRVTTKQHYQKVKSNAQTTM